MKRRAFLQTSAVAVATATTPAAAAPSGEGAIRAALDALDARCRRLERRVEPARELIAAQLELMASGDVDVGEAPFFPPEVLEHLLDAGRSVMTYGEMSALSLEDQAHPAVQRRLESACVKIAAALDGVVGWLEGLGADRLERLREGLLSDRRQLRALVHAIEDEVAAMGAPRRAVRQLRGSLRQLVFRLERQPAGAVFGDLIERFRRLQGNVARADDPLDPVRASTPREAEVYTADVEGARDRWAADAQVDASEDEPPENLDAEAEAERRRRRALGALVLGLGILSGLLLIVGAIIDPLLLVCLCVSIPLLLGTVLMIAGGIALIRGSSG